MNLLSRINVLAVIIVLLAGFSSQLAAQHQSDYQIVRNYQSEYNAILNALQGLDSVDEADALMSRIERVNNEFSEHSALINRYIFPDEFSTQVSDLQGLTNSTRRHLSTVAEQENRINEKEQQISSLTTNLSEAGDEAEELRERLQQMTRDRNANRAVAQNLRRELEKRDEFILGLVDSLFVAYDNLDLASLSPGEREEFALRADRDNVVGHVGSVVDNNISFIDTHTQLSSADYLKLRANYRKFNDAWTKLGNKLADVYEAAGERTNKVQEVNEKISTWGTRLDEAVWRSLRASFSNRGIELDSFNDSSSFYSALNSYVDGALSRVDQDGGSEEEVERYNNFADVWHNDVKVNWQEFLIDGGLLSYENIATIDRKLSDWNVGAEPRSNSWLIIAAILGLVVLVLIVLLVSQSSKKEKTVVREKR